MKNIVILAALSAALLAACSTRDQSGVLIAAHDLVFDAETARSFAPGLNHARPEQRSGGSTAGQRQGRSHQNNAVRATTLIAFALNDATSGSDDRAENLIPLLFYVSDAACDDYFTVLQSSRNGVVTALDLASIFSAGSAAVAGANNANEWAGASGAFGASRRALELNLLSNMQLPVIYYAVRSARVERRNTILAALEEEGLSGKPALRFVVAEMADYHAMCGVSFGSQQVAQYVRSTNPEPRVIGDED